MSERKPGILPRFSVGRPVTVLMLLVTILVLGFIAYTRVRIALFPEGMEQKSLFVFVNVPNATPADIEQTVMRPIEDIVGTIPGVSGTQSWANSGFCRVRVSFRNDMDIDDAYAELRDRMDRVMPDMPDEVDRINVRGWDENQIPIMEMMATLPTATAEDAQFAIEQFVQPALQRIDGVGSVETWGVRSKQVIIQMRQDRVAAHNLDLAQVVSRLRGQDENQPGGWVIEGGRKFYVRSLGRYSTLAEIENLVVDSERGLRVSDVATVAYEQPRQDRINRVDGKSAINIGVLRTGTGNIVQISQAIRAAVEELRELPQLQGLHFDVLFDQGQHVQDSIDNLRNTGMWGGLFAAVILYLFLRAPRMTGIITLAIPLSLLCTIGVIYFMGWTLNMATMMGLLLSVGMVVDNSIVIVENIYRKRQEGVEARKASIDGAGEVGLAIVMSTLTSVVVFLPLMLMGGDQEFSFWMLRIGVPVICSLLASLFIALIFIPLAALKLSRGTRHHDLRLISWSRDLYSRVLRWSLAHRATAMLIVSLVMASIWYPMQHMQRTDRAGGGEDNVRLFIDMPTGQTLEQADVFVKRLETAIMAKRENYNIQRLETRFWADNGRIQIIREAPQSSEWYANVWRGILEATGARKARLTREEIEKDLKDTIEAPPGFTLRTNFRDNPQQQQSSTSVSLYGEDTETLLQLAAEVERRLLTIPQIIEVDTDMDRGGQELRIQLDRDQARRLGVEPQAISSNISATLRGMRLGQFRAPNGREVDVQVQLEDAENTDLSDVRRLSFRNRDGAMVPLESVASLSVTRTLGQIRRENRQTTLRVTARAMQTDAKAMYAAVDQAMAGMNFPQGYRWDKGQRWFRMQESNQAQMFAGIMAMSFVFFLMGVLFESFLLPLAVIISVPFAFLGVYWMLFLTGTPFDMMSGIGVVILIGVVVNNAIVLVDLVNRLRTEGMARAEALILAGRHRFRPILMTTCTTVCGMIPMALGDSRLMEMSYAPLGRTMIGGLIASTALTLVVVPLFYTFLDDLRAFLMRVAGSALVARRSGSGEAAATAFSAK